MGNSDQHAPKSKLAEWWIQDNGRDSLVPMPHAAMLIRLTVMTHESGSAASACMACNLKLESRSADSTRGQHSEQLAVPRIVRDHRRGSHDEKFDGIDNCLTPNDEPNADDDTMKAYRDSRRSTTHDPQPTD